MKEPPGPELEGGVDARPKAPPTGELLEAFVHGCPDLLTVVDLTGRIEWVNETAERLFGRAPADCLGRDVFEFIHADDLERTRAAFAAWRRHHAPRSFSLETRVVSRSGDCEDVLWEVHPRKGDTGELLGFYSSARVVTRRKLAERTMRAEQVRLAAILASVLDPTITIDAHGTILSASQSVKTVFGYEPEDLLGENIRCLMTEPHHSQHDGYLANYRATGETNILGRTREFDVLHKDGGVLTCELSVSRVDVPGDEPCFVGSFRDVTDRRGTERKLAESAERFRAVFDQELQYVGLLTREGRVVEMNSAALAAIDADLAEVLGREFWDTPWWPPSSRWTERVRRAVAAAALGETVRFEVALSNRRHEARAVDFSLKPIRAASGEVHMLLAEGRDVTELNKARRDQQQVQHSLARIGESAAVLAHEIKSPLAAVNVALRAVARHLGEDERSVLEDLTQRMKRLERMVRGTLSLTRPLEIHERVNVVQETLDDAARQVELEARQKRVEVESARTPAGLTGLYDPELVAELVTNLARNAVEAVRSGGRVLLRAAQGPDTLQFFVEDDGPGIPASILATLFDPYVTTKVQGTGLGLAICRKVAEAHEGSLGVKTSELGGACFELRIPLPEEEEE